MPRGTLVLVFMTFAAARSSRIALSVWARFRPVLGLKLRTRPSRVTSTGARYPGKATMAERGLRKQIRKLPNPILCVSALDIGPPRPPRPRAVRLTRRNERFGGFRRVQALVHIEARGVGRGEYCLGARHFVR